MILGFAQSVSNANLASLLYQVHSVQLSCPICNSNTDLVPLLMFVPGDW